MENKPPLGVHTLQQDINRLNNKTVPESTTVVLPPKQQNSETAMATALQEISPIRTIKPENMYEAGKQEVLKATILSPENTPKNIQTLHPIRTYSSDIADAVKAGASLTKMAAAENERKVSQSPIPEDEPEGTHWAKIILTIIFSLIFVAAGSWGIWYAYKKYSLKTAQTVVIRNNDWLLAEKTKTITMPKKADILISQLRNEVETASIGLGTIERIVPTVPTDSPNTQDANTVRPVDTSIFIQALAPNASGSLIRSFDSTFYFGIEGVHSNQPFLILRVNSFENAMAGMLAWEPKMIQDLQGVFLRSSDRVKAPFYTIGTSSEQYRFEDAVFQNKDLRIVRNLQNDPVLLYSFIDTKTLIITSDEAVLKDIIDRLIKAQLIR